MSAIIDGLLFSWQKNKDYAVRLVSDLSEQQMIAQPQGVTSLPANHAAWVMSHLNIYLPIIESIIEGKPFEDPKSHQFGMDSKPESDPSVYASRDDLVNQWNAGHDRVTSLLQSADDSVFSNPIELERWKSVFPTAGVALPYLMLLHENTHLGQLSAWRRVQGMPSV